MKTNFFNYVIPMALAVIGLTSAASSSSITKADLAPEIGYKQIENGPEPCQAVQECDNLGDFACTAPDSSQLYAGSSASCTVPLLRSTE